METESSQNPSPWSSSSTPLQNPVESYIGSFVTLISNHDLRYEGVLHYLNLQDSTLGLQTVIWYGKEGRNNDGFQIHPYNKVYDYILFNGADIKEIIVKPPTSFTRGISKSCHATKPPLPPKIRQKLPLISNEKLLIKPQATTDSNAFSVEGSVNDSFHHHIASQPQFPGSNFYDPWFNYVYQYMPYDALNQDPIIAATSSMVAATSLMVAATQSFFTTCPPAPISIQQNYGGCDFEGMTKNFNQHSLWGPPIKKEEESAKPACNIDGSSYMISRKPFEPIGRPCNPFGPIARPVKRTQVSNYLQRRLQLQPPSSYF